jgi:hypothetical protein
MAVGSRLVSDLLLILPNAAAIIGSTKEYSIAAERLVAHGYSRGGTSRTKAGASRKRKRAPARRGSR